MSSSSSWTLPMDPSPDLQLALAYNTALESWNEEMLMATFDDTLDHRILPKSLRRPLLTKRLYQSYFQGLAAMFKPRRTKRTIHEVIEAEDTVILHVSTKGESVTGHSYENEFIAILHMMDSSSGDGSRKIKSVKEFVDSESSHKFFPAERARLVQARNKTGARR